MQTTVVLHAFTNLVNVQVNRRPLDSHLCECTSLYSAWCDTTGHIAPRTFSMCSGKNESKKRKSCYYCSEKHVCCTDTVQGFWEPRGFPRVTL